MKNIILLILNIVLYSITSFGEVYCSGRNSYFWITLKAKAGTSEASAEDLVLYNGYETFNLSSKLLSCQRVDNGSYWLYNIAWKGNNFTGTDKAQVLKFTIKVEAFSNATYFYSDTSGYSSVTSLGKIATPSDIDDIFGVGGDNDLDAGEVLRFTITDNITIDGILTDSLNYFFNNSFVNIVQREVNSGFGHKFIIGEGTNLISGSFNDPTNTVEISGTSFTITGAGSNVSTREWGIESIKFKLQIRNPELLTEDLEHPFSDLENNYNADSLAVWLNSTAAELEKNLKPWSWEHPQRWIEVRKSINGGVFTQEEMDILCQASNVVSINNQEETAKFEAAYPGILYRAGYLNLEKDVSSNGLTGNFQEHPEYYIYNPDGTPYVGGDCPYFNLANPETREYWLNEAAKQISGNEYTGKFFFIDALAKVGVIEGSDCVDYWGNPIGENYYDNARILMEEFRKRFGDKVFIVGNFARPNTGDIRTEFTMKYTHIAYIEKFEQFNDYVATAHQAIRLMQTLTKAGKWLFISVNGYSKPTPMKEPTLEEKREKAAKAMPEVWAKLEATGEQDELAELYAYFPFKLAMFLMGAGRRSYLRYVGEHAVRVGGTDLFKIAQPFPEWNMKLGEPLEDAVQNGNVWRRRFKYVDVELNLDSGTYKFIHRQEGRGTNIAVFAKASQSSTVKNGDAYRAIDGNIDGSFNFGSVACTKEEKNPWWEIDFGGDKTIYEINVFGRIDEGFPNGLLGYRLYLIDSSGDTTFSEAFDNSSAAAINANGAKAKKLRIQLDGQGVLSLAEVEVFSDSPVTSVLSRLDNSDNIKAYPNPFKNILIIETFNKELVFAILDKYGKSVYTGKIKNNKIKVDLSSLPQGTYFLKIGNKTKKIYKIANVRRQ